MVMTDNPSGTHEPDLADMGAQADTAALLLKTLAHPARLMIACALVENEYSVGELEEKLGIHQPTLSQQLTVLRQAGVVETRRHGKQVIYRLTAERAARLIESLYDIFCNQGARA